MDKSQVLPIIMNLIAAIFGAFGQYYYKIGGTKIGEISIWKNWQIYLGIILFCVVMALFVASYKFGGRLSVVYPVYATTFVWGLLIAIFWEQEPYSSTQIIGTVVVMLGVSLIAMGSSN